MEIAGIKKIINDYVKFDRIYKEELLNKTFTIKYILELYTRHAIIPKSIWFDKGREEWQIGLLSPKHYAQNIYNL